MKVIHYNNKPLHLFNWKNKTWYLYDDVENVGTFWHKETYEFLFDEANPDNAHVHFIVRHGHNHDDFWKQYKNNKLVICDTYAVHMILASYFSYPKSNPLRQWFSKISRKEV